MQQIIADGLVAWAGPAGLSLLAVAFGFGLYRFVVFLVVRYSKPNSVSRIFFDASTRALSVVLFLVALNSVLHAVPQDLPFLFPVQRITVLLMVISITWAAVGFTSAIGEVIVKLNPAFEDE